MSHLDTAAGEYRIVFTPKVTNAGPAPSVCLILRSCRSDTFRILATSLVVRYLIQSPLEELLLAERLLWLTGVLVFELGDLAFDPTTEQPTVDVPCVAALVDH